MKTRNNSKNIFSLIFLLLLSMSSLSNYSTKKITLAKDISNLLIQKQMIDNDDEHFCKCEDEDLMRSKVKIDDFKLKDKNLFGANKHLKKEVIDGKDYGHPGIYKNFQILKNEFREIYIKDNMLAGCPNGYRVMSLEDIHLIEKDVKKKSLYEVLIDEESFNIKSSFKYVLNTRSYPEVNIMEDDRYYLKKTFYLDEETESVRFTDLNPVNKKEVQFKCILDEEKYKLKIRIINSERSDNIIGLDQSLIVMINNANIRDVIWKTDYSKKEKETIKVVYKKEGCTNIHAWGVLPSDQIVYGCRAFYAKNLKENKIKDSNSVKQVPSIVTYNKKIGVLKNELMPSQIPFIKNSDEEIVLFYTNKETLNLHLLVLNKNLQEISDLDLNTSAYGLDIKKSHKYYIILCRDSKNDSHMYLYALNLDFKFSWKRDVVYNLPDPTFEESIDQNTNVIFKNTKGEFEFGMNKIFKIISGKIEFSGNRIGVLFSHLNLFSKYKKWNHMKYLGSTFLTFDEDGQNEKLGFSWAASPTIDLNLRSDGENFITSSLSGGYPDNIVICSISINKYSQEKDFYNRAYKHVVKCKSLSNDSIPADGKGNSCGRMSKILYDNNKTFSIVSSSSSCNEMKKFYPNHRNKFSITFFDKELNIKSHVDLGNFDNIKCLDSVRLGNNIAIVFTTALLSNQSFFKINLNENNSKTYIMFLDSQGNIFKSAREVNSIECGNIGNLNNSSFALSYLNNDGKLQIMKSNEFQI